jgi:RNA 2',3'-cyclic 3'-phosphodiesterase
MFVLDDEGRCLRMFAMKRLFVAIRVVPDAGFISRYRALKSSLSYEPIKWVEEQNIHITLKFLGETSEERIPGINAVLEKVAGSFPSFELALKGLGIFGSSYNPKVIWAGIHPYDRLVTLMKLVHEGLEPEGFPMERQNLVPHLTLGRIKPLRDKKRFQSEVEKFKYIASASQVVDRIILFESNLKKEGPEYHVLRAHSLQ